MKHTLMTARNAYPSMTAAASASFEISHPVHVASDEKKQKAITMEALTTKGGKRENFAQNSGRIMSETNVKIPPGLSASTVRATERSTLSSYDVGTMSTLPLSTSRAKVTDNPGADSVRSAECDCSPCECELPSEDPCLQTFTTNDCFCDPCQCSLFPSSASLSKKAALGSQMVFQECHCAPCECSIPPNSNHGGSAKTITPNECTCSRCECSPSPSNVSSDAGVVRGPSPIPSDLHTKTHQIVENEFANQINNCHEPPGIHIRPTSVNASPTLQAHHGQGIPFLTPYSYQTATQQLGSQAPQFSSCGQALYNDAHQIAG